MAADAGPRLGRARPPGPPAGPSRRLESGLQRLWFGPPSPLVRLLRAALWPLSSVVAGVAGARRQRIAAHKASARGADRPPVVVVGNLVVGGTGKTPLLIALVEALAARGWRPGVLARGYRSRAEHGPARLVADDDDAAAVGDEPLLVARRTGRPVAVGRNRARALALLAQHPDCNLVLADDGLQHEPLPRDLELAVFDARGAGNRLCLPAGPLREPLRDALLLDALVLNGPHACAPIVHSRVFRFEVVPVEAHTLDGTRRWSAARFAAEVGALPSAGHRMPAGRPEPAAVDALAGIGTPQRFFDTLAALGIPARTHPLPDHAAIDPHWLAALPGPLIVMTEKDAVKCAAFDAALLARCVALRVEAVPEPALVDWLEERLRG
jgi:tetraacyldisaccharide 4'-kinase